MTIEELALIPSRVRVRALISAMEDAGLSMPHNMDEADKWLESSQENMGAYFQKARQGK